MIYRIAIDITINNEGDSILESPAFKTPEEADAWYRSLLFYPRKWEDEQTYISCCLVEYDDNGENPETVNYYF